MTETKMRECGPDYRIVAVFSLIIGILSFGLLFAVHGLYISSEEQRVAAAMEQCPPLPVAPGRVLEIPSSGKRVIVLFVGRDAAVRRWQPCDEAMVVRVNDSERSIVLDHDEAQVWLSANSG